jgi:hypothetical protein
MQAGELPVYVGRIADALQGRAARAAANAMAVEFHRELTDVTLRKSSHAIGTQTPSQPGQPPALMSGTLRRSARAIPAVASGSRATAEVRVGTVYARIQEKGGTVTVKRAKVLGNPKVGFFGQSVTLPKRPYIKPTRDLLLTTRRFQKVATDAITAVVEEAAG